MAEDVARALGAGSPFTFTIAGRECQARPLTVRELTEVERECLKDFKDQYLATYARNLHLFPRGDRSTILAQKVDEAAKWDVSDLPHKHAFDPSGIRITQPLRERIKSDYQLNGEIEVTDEFIARLAATSLDSGTLKEDEYEKLAGTTAIKRRVPYVAWWTSGCFDGQVTLIWMCFRKSGVTKDEVAEAFTIENMAQLVNLGREIEHLSAPQSGNGPGSPK